MDRADQAQRDCTTPSHRAHDRLLANRTHDNALGRVPLHRVCIGFSWSAPSENRYSGAMTGLKTGSSAGSFPVWRLLAALFLLGALQMPLHAQLRGHGGPVRALAVSADGTR